MGILLGYKPSSSDHPIYNIHLHFIITLSCEKVYCVVDFTIPFSNLPCYKNEQSFSEKSFLLFCKTKMSSYIARE